MDSIFTIFGFPVYLSTIIWVLIINGLFFGGAVISCKVSDETNTSIAIIAISIFIIFISCLFVLMLQNCN